MTADGYTDNLGGFPTGGMRLRARLSGHSVLVRRTRVRAYDMPRPWEWCVVRWSQGCGWPLWWGTGTSQQDALAWGLEYMAQGGYR